MAKAYRENYFDDCRSAQHDGRWRSVPAGRARSNATLRIGSEQNVVVMAAGRYPVEGLRFGELVVEDPAPSVVRPRWRRGVHRVAIVKGEVARLSIERHDGEITLLAPREPVLRVAVRSGKDEQLSVVGVGRVELHTGLDERAHHRVPA